MSKPSVVSVKRQQSEAPHAFTQPRGILLLGGLYLGILLLFLAPAIALSQQAQLPTFGTTGTNNAMQRSLSNRNRNRPGSIEGWVRQLKDEDPETRLTAVKHLGISNNPDAVESLIEAMADPDIRIKVKAVDYLGNLRATDSIPILVQQLYLRDVDLGIKHKVLVALGKIGDPRAGEPIAEFLKRNLKSDIRGSAIFALAETGGVKELLSLERVAEEMDDPRIQGLAVIVAEEIRQRLSPATVKVEPTLIMLERLRAEAEAKAKGKKK
jgi:hypothetical protein